MGETALRGLYHVLASSLLVIICFVKNDLPDREINLWQPLSTRDLPNEAVSFLSWRSWHRWTSATLLVISEASQTKRAVSSIGRHATNESRQEPDRHESLKVVYKVVTVNSSAQRLLRAREIPLGT